MERRVFSTTAKLFNIHSGYLFDASLAAVVFRVQIAGQHISGTASGSGSSAKQKAAGKVTRMCVIIATTFTVAWTPYQLNQLVFAYGNIYHAVLLLDAFETMTYINSCLNPIVYALMWRPFRLSLVQVRRSCP